jgi:hypothetical protein
MPLNISERWNIRKFLGYLHVRIFKTWEERQDPASFNQGRSETAYFHERQSCMNHSGSFTVNQDAAWINPLEATNNFLYSQFFKTEWFSDSTSHPTPLIFWTPCALFTEKSHVCSLISIYSSPLIKKSPFTTTIRLTTLNEISVKFYFKGFKKPFT